MKTHIESILLLSLCGALAGCPEEGDEDGNDDNKSTEAVDSDSSGMISTDTRAQVVDHCADPVATVDEDGNILVIASDRLNYSFSSSLSIQSVGIRSMSDFTVDWSDVTEDLQGHDFNPLTSVDMMELSLWQYTKEALMTDINNDTLDTGRLVVLGKVPTDNAVTSANFLSLLSPNGSELEDAELLGYTDTVTYAPEDHTYLIMVAEGQTLGDGTKLLSFFDPSPDETNTEILFTNNTTELSYTVDLTSLKRIAVPPSVPDIVLDWEEVDLLHENAMGRPWIPTKITDVMVAKYADKSPEDLEAVFLDLELIADEMYTAFLSAGQRLNFKFLTDDAGNAFQGIDDSGTWIVALKCGLDCENPAPWFLSVLHPCAE